MAGERYMTRDRDRIREWVEERGGKPATVSSTRTEDDPGLIRLDFPGYSGAGSLKEISWDDWFRKFEESDLVLLFQETLADGGKSNFNKLISSDTAEENDGAEWVEGAAAGGRSKGSGGNRGESRSRKSSGADGRVDLNKASAEELDGVFGIGPATARKIVEYRDKELGGSFHSAHDITHIPGIGEATAKSILENARAD